MMWWNHARWCREALNHWNAADAALRPSSPGCLSLSALKGLEGQHSGPGAGARRSERVALCTWRGQQPQRHVRHGPGSSQAIQVNNVQAEATKLLPVNRLFCKLEL